MTKNIPPLVTLAFCTAFFFYLLSIEALRAGGLVLLLVLGIMLFSLSNMFSFILHLNPDIRVPLYRIRRLFRILAISCVFAVGCALAAVPRFLPGQDPEFISEIEGILITDSRYLDTDRIISRVRVQNAISTSGTTSSSKGSLTVLFDGEGNDQCKPFEDLPRGTHLRFKGKILQSEKNDLFLAHSFILVSAPHGFALARHRLRRDLIRRLESRPWGGMALALLLGWRDGLHTGIQDRYRSAGASHVLALSGMHLAILSTLLLLLLRRPLGLVFSALLSLLVLGGYVYLAGSQSSLLRALLMYAITVFTLVRALPAPSILVLSLSFILQILATPLEALSPAFILSYLALGGILVLANPLSDLLPAVLPPVIRSPLAASLGAFLCTLPVQALFFNTAYPVGIIASMPLAALAGIMMLLAMVWIPLDLIWNPLAFPVDALANFCNRSMDYIAHQASRAPCVLLNSFPLTIIFTLSTVSAILLLHRTLSRTRRNCVIAA